MVGVRMILGINYLRFVPGAVLDMGMSIRLNNPYFFFLPWTETQASGRNFLILGLYHKDVC